MKVTVMPPNEIDQSKAFYAALARSAMDFELNNLKPAADHLKDAQDELSRQTAGYAFDCTRYGDFLQVSIQRAANPAAIQHYCTTINLIKVDTVRLVNGKGPSYDGVVDYFIENPMSEWDGYCYRVDTVKTEPKAIPLYPQIPTARDLFLMNEHKPVIVYDTNLDRYKHRVSHHTKNYPCAAHDDEIIFERLGATIFAPCGMGEMVLQKILTATDRLKAA